MLVILSVVALIKVGDGSAPIGDLTPSWSWFNPFGGNFSDFVDGLTLMLFIYWGRDTAVSGNEETADKAVTPGKAAVISTIVLLAIYELVVLSARRPLAHRRRLPSGDGLARCRGRVPVHLPGR
jgi:amino acid transporter